MSTTSANLKLKTKVRINKHFLRPKSYSGSADSGRNLVFQVGVDGKGYLRKVRGTIM